MLKTLFSRLAGAAAPSALEARWVVFDCETSGLDPHHDRLLAVGAVAVRAARVVLAESYAAVLRAQVPSTAANIEVHGIGGDAQLGGRAPQEALREFEVFREGAPLVAFHAPFDAAVLSRAMPAAGLAAPGPWLDLAQLAPALYPGRSHRALDDWLGEFGIAPLRRHDALGDALATAQLFLVLLAEGERQGAHRVADLQRLQREARWLGSR